MNELHEKISRWMVGSLLLLQARLCREKEKERVKERGCIKCHKTAASENWQGVGEHNK